MWSSVPERRNPTNTSREEKIAEQYVNFVTATSVPRAMTVNDIQAATSRDPTLMKAIDLARTGRWFEIEKITDPAINIHELRQYNNCRDELTCHVDNILLKDDKIVIPTSLLAVSLAHEGHQGMARTKAMIRSKVWFPGINEKVEQKIHKCLACQAVYSKPGPFEPLRVSELPPGAWQNLSMDFCGPLPTGEYLMVVMDEYSRYPIVEIVKSVSANTVIPVLDKVLSTFGCCKIIKTDNGSPFNSHTFAKFAEFSGFKHRRITPHWPRANAQAESFNKPMMKLVRTAHLEHKPWKQELHKFLRQYRATPHPSTGVTPHQLMFGREPRTRLPQFDLNSPPISDYQVRAHDVPVQAKRKQKQYADNRLNVRHNDIDIGNTVLVKHDNKPSKLATIRPPALHCHRQEGQYDNSLCEWPQHHSQLLPFQRHPCRLQQLPA